MVGMVLPDYERLILQAAPIELGIVQVRFPPLTRFDDGAFLASLQAQLTVDYPMVTEGRAINLVMTPAGVQQTQGDRQLRFGSIDQSNTVLLTKDLVSLEMRNYTSIDDFAGRFAKVLEAVSTHLGVRHQLRFGLRYINEFRHPRGGSLAGWRELLNAAFSTPALDELLDGTAQQTLGESRIERPDGSLLIRYGFLTGTTVLPDSPSRQPKSGPFYLLDLDYFDERPQGFDLEAPILAMRQYNNVMYRVFRWAVGEGELFQYLLAGGQ